MKKVVISALVVSAAVISSCAGDQSGQITSGDKSKMDSLSYALGANVAYGVSSQMGDVPFDYKLMAEGLEDAAFDKGDVTSEESIKTLQSYFRDIRPLRTQIVAKKRAQADSVAIANGADPSNVAVSAAARERESDPDMFESESQRKEVSYAFGIDLGTNLKSADIPVEIYWMNKGLIDANLGSAKFSATEAVDFLQNYFTVVRPAEVAAISAENLADIEKKSGVVKTESGLLYRVEVEGDKEVIAVEDTDVVKVNYTGRLIRTDKVFDTSRFADRTEEQKEALKVQNPEGYDQDSPIEFALNRVIPGWTEGMKLVGKGGRISLWIPSELAYGANGAGRDIGPNEALYFDVEIIDVNPVAAE